MDVTVLPSPHPPFLSTKYFFIVAILTFSNVFSNPVDRKSYFFCTLIDLLPIKLLNDSDDLVLFKRKKKVFLLYTVFY